LPEAHLLLAAAVDHQYHLDRHLLAAVLLSVAAVDLADRQDRDYHHHFGHHLPSYPPNC